MYYYCIIKGKVKKKKNPFFLTSLPLPPSNTSAWEREVTWGIQHERLIFSYFIEKSLDIQMEWVFTYTVPLWAVMHMAETDVSATHAQDYLFTVHCHSTSSECCLWHLWYILLLVCIREKIIIWLFHLLLIPKQMQN